ncbi:MAG: 3-deoxy-D-manno-octulosonic acid transferase [Chitinophagaceae bacterium]|nr:3-deoxy-D-manno-octulosonic acid transferase [Chitinophagaceae bacterium]
MAPQPHAAFLQIVQPKLVIFVKYEFWYYYLKKIKYRNIPLVLVSAIFREKMTFFRWYGALPEKMLSRFEHLFVQDQNSLELLSKIDLGNITTVSGDTRFDRVVMIADKAPTNAVVEHFARGRKLIVAGSTWPPDEDLLANSLELLPREEFALVIAPHEIHEQHLQSIEAKFPGLVRYSALAADNTPSPTDATVLLIDNIGLLSQLYRHAWICLIGGGFGKGIHNTLEAAVYGKPVFFGPVHQKFREALELKEVQGAFAVSDHQEFVLIVQNMLVNPTLHENSAKASKDYVRSRVGATNIIMHYFQEKRLLTN